VDGRRPGGSAMAVLISAVATVALAVGVAFPAAAAAGTTGAGSIWRVVPTPNPGGGQVSNITFTGVSASSPTDAWAVGIDEVSSFRRPLVERWDGTAWRAVRVPQPPGQQAWFQGVIDLSPTDAWAVGVRSDPQNTNQDQRTLIEHWDGVAWSIVRSPNPATGFTAANVLEAIDGVGPADLWAAGWDLDPSSQTIELLFEHWDGTRWRVADSPTPPGAFQFAQAVDAAATDDVWAVGSNALETTLSAHWDGRRWSVVPTPNLHDGQAPTNRLTGVTSAGPGDVWASGYEDNVDQRNFAKPYMLHWDGGAWTLVRTPNLGEEGTRLRATTALGPDDVWAVGQVQENDGSILTFTQRFDGGGWTVVPSPNPGHVGNLLNNSLTAVAGAGGGVLLAVGARETTGQCCLRTLALMTRSG
jgi:hypothetical protein